MIVCWKIHLRETEKHRALVSGGQFCSQETLWAVATQGGDISGIQWVETKQRTIWPKMLAVQLLRNPDQNKMCASYHFLFSQLAIFGSH